MKDEEDFHRPESRAIVKSATIQWLESARGNKLNFLDT